MTAELILPPLVSDLSPRWACLSELRLGDLVKFPDIDPVTILGGDLEDVHHVFDWMRFEKDGTLSEGRGVHDIGQVLLIARAEQVPAAMVRAGDVLLEPRRASPYQVVAERPLLKPSGLLDIPWWAGRLPQDGHAVIGGMLRAPHQTVRRAARGVTL
jgi:hypothetical protein